MKGVNGRLIVTRILITFSYKSGITKKERVDIS